MAVPIYKDPVVISIAPKVLFIGAVVLRSSPMESLGWLLSQRQNAAVDSKTMANWNISGRPYVPRIMPSEKRVF